MYRFHDGQLAKRWAVRDDLKMLRQLGALPSGARGTRAIRPLPPGVRERNRWNGQQETRRRGTRGGAMTRTHKIASGQLIDLSTHVVGLVRDTRQAVLVDQEPGRHPHRIDGVTIGAPLVTGQAPHDGEVHPDGDELLYLMSGAMSLRLEYPDGDVEVEVHAGEAVVIPRGVWHKLTLREPGQLLHITPGIGGDARPPPGVSAGSDIDGRVR
jgi:mannose-6-phosphate isomerase-like protein (cupin superfamily)